MTPCYMTTAQRLSKPVYVQLASSVDAFHRCATQDKLNLEWEHRHRERIESIVKTQFPSGSGFDAGTTLNLVESSGEKLVFETSFHHMNEHGFYDGWTEHKVTVRPSLIFGYTLTISGRDKNGIKELIGQRFREALDYILTERDMLDYDESNGYDVDEARKRLDERDEKESLRYVCNGRLFNTEDEAKTEAKRYFEQSGGSIISIMPVKRG